MTPTTSPIISLDRIGKSFAGQRALDGLSATIHPGQFVAIIGRSGAGKTTLLRCLTRATPVTTGAIRFGDVDLAAQEGRALREHRGRVGMIYQQFNLVKRLRVMDNVLVGRLPHVRGWRRWAALVRRFDAGHRDVALRCLEHVGLLDRAWQRADTLSGGEQQGVAIARILAQDPRVILADEPAASLDVHNGREYYKGKWALSDVEIDEMIERRLHDRERYGEAHRAAISRVCATHAIPLASHDDATLAHVEDAAKIGTVVAEFPTTLEAARACRAYGLAVLAGAPNLVLGRSHSGNVAVGELAGEGLVNILSSDYVPASALHGAYRLHRAYGMSLPTAIATVSATPAARVGLDDRGHVAPGRRADLLRVRLAGDLPVVRTVWVAGERVA